MVTTTTFFSWSINQRTLNSKQTTWLTLLKPCSEVDRTAPNRETWSCSEYPQKITELGRGQLSHNSLLVLASCKCNIRFDLFTCQMYKSGVSSSLDELISNLNQLSQRMDGFTVKTYNMLAVTLHLKNDQDRAIKIFETAVNELKLDTE